MSLFSIFDKPTELALLIDECTSEMQLNTDFALNMQVCDHINRIGTSAAKDAIKVVRKKLKSSSSNPKTCLLTLSLLEMMMKNCRAEFHLEASNSSFLKELEELATSVKTDVRVRDKILELIQSWADAFSAFKDDLPMFDALYVRMKRQGVSFPDRDLSGLVPILTPDGSRATRMLPPEINDTDAYGRPVSNAVQPELLTRSRVPAAPVSFQPVRTADHRGFAQLSGNAAAPNYVATPTMVALPSHSQPIQLQRGGPHQYQAAPVAPRAYQYQGPPPNVHGHFVPSHGHHPRQPYPLQYASIPAQAGPGSGWLQAAHGRQPSASSDATTAATMASLKDFIASCLAASELYAALHAAGDSSDLIQDLKAQCMSLQDRLGKTIPEIQNEELLLQALSANDDLIAALTGKSVSAGAASAVAQREGNLLDLDFSTSPASAQAQAPATLSQSDAFMDDIFGSSAAVPPQVQQHASSLPPGWEILVDQRGRRYYGHPGMKVTQYEHPSLGVVQRNSQPFQQNYAEAVLPHPPFLPLQQQPMLAIQQPTQVQAQGCTQGTIARTPNTPPPFRETAPATDQVQSIPPNREAAIGSPSTVPVVSIDVFPDVQQPTSAGGVASIRPPPKAMSKKPAKQVTEKQAAEYAKLEDNLFEL